MVTSLPTNSPWPQAFAAGPLYSGSFKAFLTRSAVLGSWQTIRPTPLDHDVLTTLGHKAKRPVYAGRVEAASPATGSYARHNAEQEKLVATYLATQTGKQQIFGNGTVTVASAPMIIGYDATWYGAAAEMTDAQVRTLLQTLGWSVAW